MKNRSATAWFIVLAMIQLSVWTTASNAADEPTKAEPANDLNLVPSAPILPPQLVQKMQQLQGRSEITAKAIAGTRPRTNLANNIRTAAEAVRDAKGDDGKEAAQKKLTD